MTVQQRFSYNHVRLHIIITGPMYTPLDRTTGWGTKRTLRGTGHYMSKVRYMYQEGYYTWTLGQRSLSFYVLIQITQSTPSRLVDYTHIVPASSDPSNSNSSTSESPLPSSASSSMTRLRNVTSTFVFRTGTFLL